mgnify:CR=1 FL=1
MTCEWCWNAANERVMSRGGSTVVHYEEILREQNAMGEKASCTVARAIAAPPNVPSKLPL